MMINGFKIKKKSGQLLSINIPHKEWSKIEINLFKYQNKVNH